MRHTLALAAFVFAATAALGCGAQQPSQSQSQPQSTGASQSDSQLVIAPKVSDEPAHPLPFKGRLVAGDPTELPPAVAMSLSGNSTVTFTYREELTHDDYHVPLIVSALDRPTWSVLRWAISGRPRLRLCRSATATGFSATTPPRSTSRNRTTCTRIPPTRKWTTLLAPRSAAGSIKNFTAMRPGWRMRPPARANLQLLPLANESPAAGTFGRRRRHLRNRMRGPGPTI